MGVHLIHQLLHALAAGHRIGHLLDQIGGMQAVDVGAEHLTGPDQSWLFEKLRTARSRQPTVRLVMSAGTSLYALCVDGRFSESLLYHVNAIHIVPDPVSSTALVASPNGQPDRREN